MANSSKFPPAQLYGIGFSSPSALPFSLLCQAFLISVTMEPGLRIVVHLYYRGFSLSEVKLYGAKYIDTEILVFIMEIVAFFTVMIVVLLPLSCLNLTSMTLS